MNFNYPAELRFKCTKCAICCGDTCSKSRHILLLGAEAQEIARATSQRVGKFAKRIAGKEPYNYEMKKRTEDGKCLFLKRNRCTIYPLRPLVCRFYPFELRMAGNGKHVFLFTDECQGISKGDTLGRGHFEKLYQLAHAKVEAQSRRCKNTQ